MVTAVLRQLVVAVCVDKRAKTKTIALSTHGPKGSTTHQPRRCVGVDLF